ncbi:hypothetical protein [Nonomuraea longicatena]|uniref:Uncharacterized protein n=1 Tax=Nonomuraea longicatena TaxID=83682 RepID=A0ABP4BP81_9ACTN
MRTEHELAAALRAAAGAAPDPDLLAGVAARRRTRTRRRLLSVTAALAVIAAGTATAQLQRAPDTVVAQRPPTQGPVAKVWPQALFTMPAKNGQGRHHRLIDALSATEILVVVDAERGETQRFEIHDLAKKTQRVVTTLPDPRERVGDAVTDGKQVVWYTEPGKYRYYYRAPLTGGPTTRIHKQPLHPEPNAMTMNGETVYVTDAKGVTSTVTGPAREWRRLYLITGPWAGDGPIVVTSKYTGINQTRLVNLKTGQEKRIAVPARAKGLRCGPVWCVGTRGGGEGFAQRIDGSRFTPLMGYPAQYPIRDRFVQTSLLIKDLETGTEARIEDIQGWTGTSGSLVYWGDDTTYRVLNLAAVPAPQ